MRINRKIILITCFLLGCLSFIQAQPAIDPAPLFSKVSSFEVQAVENAAPARLQPDGKKMALYVFLSPECPLCQNYTLELNRLQTKFSQQVTVYGIVPGQAYTVTDMRSFNSKYKVVFNSFIDKNRGLTHYLKATVTPQVILLDKTGRLLYSGAIDDWIQALGKNRNTASQHYVQDAIEQTLKPEPVKIKTTKPIGCKINDY